MDDNLAQYAISSCLQGDWQKAIELNSKLLLIDPENTDALNRIARAHYELGNTKDALKYTQMVLDVDSLNPIASRALEKFKTPSTNHSNGTHVMSKAIFLEEPGRTKIVKLLNPADNNIRSVLNPADTVKLSVGKHRINITSSDNAYLGKLPDDIAKRLIILIEKGGNYDAFVKTINSKEISIFLREISKPPQFNHLVSFPQVVSKTA
jgi:tetratricopeptide (TPR) repeat protein